MPHFNHTKNEVLLSIENVSLNLGGFQILKDVNANIRDIVRPDVTQGQIVGFLGPSGVGKTKLFEIMAGIIQPTSGKVWINNPPEPVKIGKIGVVQQNYPLFAHKTVWGNLEVAAKQNVHLKNGEIKDKCEEILTMFDLTQHKTYYPSQLSGGQRQRIAIAQQLICSERFLLLDEPFSGLDVNMIEKVCEMLVKISNLDEKNTIIIVSHDINSTAAISDTLWLMGRDRDHQGQAIPGANIKHIYDLIEEKLAWSPGIHSDHRFVEMMKDIKSKFKVM
jgi:polar amino acid transport system ATP-binding protein/sulfate transport system ATP-binding protein